MKKVINGMEINGWQSYASWYKFAAVKKVDGEWWFEAAGDDFAEVARIAEAQMSYAEAVEVVAIP